MTASLGRTVEEVLAPGELPLWLHPEWRQRMPWLVQGVSGRGSEAEPFDLGLFGAQPVGVALGRWQRLLAATAMQRAVHSRQVHGADLRVHGPGGGPGLLIGSGEDGHLTGTGGILLTVSIADCVPVTIVDRLNRRVALVHAGWRGVAAAIVERAVETLRTAGEGRGEELWVHCGPAICGACYEVGPEVHAAVDPEVPVPSEPTPIDLRAVIARRASALGISDERITLSAHCTRCGPGAFFSHRGGSPARQMAFAGIRE